MGGVLTSDLQVRLLDCIYTFNGQKRRNGYHPHAQPIQKAWRCPCQERFDSPRSIHPLSIRFLHFRTAAVTVGRPVGAGLTFFALESQLVRPIAVSWPVIDLFDKKLSDSHNGDGLIQGRRRGGVSSPKLEPTGRTLSEDSSEREAMDGGTATNPIHLHIWSSTRTHSHRI